MSPSTITVTPWTIIQDAAFQAGAPLEEQPTWVYWDAHDACLTRPTLVSEYADGDNLTATVVAPCGREYRVTSLDKDAEYMHGDTRHASRRSWPWTVVADDLACWLHQHGHQDRSWT